jgi:hypothetical protein
MKEYVFGDKISSRRRGEQKRERHREGNTVATRRRASNVQEEDLCGKVKTPSPQSTDAFPWDQMRELDLEVKEGKEESKRSETQQF